MTCPYAKAGDQLSLDNTVSDGEGNEKSWLDDMPDESAAIAELMEDLSFSFLRLSDRRISETGKLALLYDMVRHDGASTLLGRCHESKSALM